MRDEQGCQRQQTDDGKDLDHAGRGFHFTVGGDNAAKWAAQRAEDFVDHNPHVARRQQRHAVHFGQIVGGVTQNGVDGEDTKNHHAAIPGSADAQNGQDVAKLE